MRGLSLVVASGDHSSSRCAGLSLSPPLLLRSTGSRRAGSVVVAHGSSCSAACGIFPDQGSNPCPLHWQADSQPLRHQGSPSLYIFFPVCSVAGNVCASVYLPGAICKMAKWRYLTVAGAPAWITDHSCSEAEGNVGAQSKSSTLGIGGAGHQLRREVP